MHDLMGTLVSFAAIGASAAMDSVPETMFNAASTALTIIVIYSG